jgi:ABC-2 type transport system ATP-binding protein
MLQTLARANPPSSTVPPPVITLVGDPSETAIKIRGLVRRYGAVIAVNGIDLDIRRGECFGLLGPNGAGKTTTVEIMEGLIEPSAGSVELLGKTWAQDATQLRAWVGVSLQEATLFERLTVEETLHLFRSFYLPGQARAVEDLLIELRLTDKRSARVRDLSGGQRQRLAIGVALVGDPEIVFLDEPTTGLDPQSRRALWDTISSLRERGKTIVLTTHYMDEAERLCDRVAIVDAGKVIALGTPAAMIDSIGGQNLVELRCEPDVAPTFLEATPAVRSARRHGEGLALCIDEPHIALPAIFAALAERGARATRLISRAATLEDVFVSLTGRNLRED